MADIYHNTQWHRLFARLLQELLTPVGLDVKTELPVSTDPPKIDVVIIRRKTKHWTGEQLERLPAGVRATTAPYILLEFKYTESFNEDAIYQVVSNEQSYRKAQKLSKKKVQSFLVISKTPQAARLKKYGYEPTETKGVCKSNNVLITRFPMLVLNELGNEPYNVYFKLFASRLSAKQQAVTVLQEEDQKQSFSRAFTRLVNSLVAHWFIVKGDDLMFDFTPEQLIEADKVFKDFIFPRMPYEERLIGMPIEKRLAGIPLEKRLAGIPVEEQLASISLEQLEKTNLKKVPLLNQIEEKGERKATLEALNRIISLRFKAKPERFTKQLTALPLNALKSLTDVALTAENLTDFKQKLAEIQAKKKAKKAKKTNNTL